MWPCPRVEGPTPQLATKRSLVPGVLFFSLVPGARWYPTLKPRQFFHTKTNISRTRVHTGRRTDFFLGVYQLETRFARIIFSFLLMAPYARTTRYGEAFFPWKTKKKRLASLAHLVIILLEIILYFWYTS